jgi:hypothetical protein
MAIDIDDAFVKQYEEEVHQAYQRQGSMLRPFTRQKNNIVGESTTFQKTGKGQASQKARNAMVPTMSVTHDPVLCSLSDYYAGDFVDKLDELKINHDERMVIANAGAWALGRKTDDLILTALNGATTTISPTGMTVAAALTAVENLGNGDVPTDNGRVGVVGWQQWTDLLQLADFRDSDIIGPNVPVPEGGFEGRRWLGTFWFPHSGLTKVSTTRQCFTWHRTAIGHASGADIQADITWQGLYAAWFINHMMSQGACLIDDTGVNALDVTEA